MDFVTYYLDGDAELGAIRADALLHVMEGEGFTAIMVEAPEGNNHMISKARDTPDAILMQTDFPWVWYKPADAPGYTAWAPIPRVYALMPLSGSKGAAIQLYGGAGFHASESVTRLKNRIETAERLVQLPGGGSGNQPYNPGEAPDD